MCDRLQGYGGSDPEVGEGFLECPRAALKLTLFFFEGEREVCLVAVRVGSKTQEMFAHLSGFFPVKQTV